MSTIVFDCDVTEYDIIPKKDNDENTFAINEKCLIMFKANGSKRLDIEKSSSNFNAAFLADLGKI